MGEKQLIDWWKRLNKCSCIYVPSKLCFLVLFLVTMILSLVFFLAFIISQESIVSYTKRYDDLSSGCKYPADNQCTLQIEIEEDMDSPVFLYYELHNFHQNHRIYSKSYSLPQLKGEDPASVTDECDPITDIEELEDHMTDHSFTLLNTDPSATADPCGLIAASFFNDSFIVKNSSGEVIPLETDEIVWTSDEDVFENDGGEWLNKEDPHFNVWMRTSGYKNFKKLYAKIDQDFKKDDIVSIEVTVNSDYSSFDGEKRVMISTANSLGTSNKVIGWFFFVTFLLSLGEIIGFFVLLRYKAVHTAESYFKLTSPE